ncbi:MAG: hypothetical protein K0B00_10795 [Rhodobacteraceae bacterium]|nr:hypothetical protein [Paracoccaceae bacterium]
MSDAMNAVALLLPVVVYLSLCRLAAGREALIGVGFAAVVAALAWIAAPDMRALVLVAAPGIAAAALVQGVRLILGARLTRGGYWALVGLPVFVAVAWLLARGA